MDYDDNNNKEKLNMSRSDILSLLDDFIEQINQIRRTLFGVSISALLLSPLAIVLSIYLMVHPSFFAILEIENEFGLVLSVLLSAVILISSIWLIIGIRQYLSLSSWNSRYKEYNEQKQKIDKMIESKYGLDNNYNNDSNINNNNNYNNNNHLQQKDFKNDSVS
jgi:NADH:ubiquinone oxidoreductase subunit 5 (subunit L)/multisubunit Na+/H+ antiporter MnhA subunit